MVINIIERQVVIEEVGRKVVGKRLDGVEKEMWSEATARDGGWKERIERKVGCPIGEGMWMWKTGNE